VRRRRSARRSAQASAPAADVSGFTDRALPSTTLAPGFSVTGYVYYPAGTYTLMEILLRDERSDAVTQERVPIEAPR
jgi:hypothetical protein